MPSFDKDFFSASKIFLGTSCVALASPVYQVEEENPSIFGLKLEDLSEAKLEESLFVVASISGINFLLKFIYFAKSEEGYIREFWSLWADLKNKLETLNEQAEMFSKLLGGQARQIEKHRADFTRKQSDEIARWPLFAKRISACWDSFGTKARELDAKLDSREINFKQSQLSDAYDSLYEELDRARRKLEEFSGKDFIVNGVEPIADEIRNYQDSVNKIAQQYDKFVDLMNSIQIQRRISGLEYWRLLIFSVALPPLIFISCIPLLLCPSLLSTLENWDGVRAMFTKELVSE